MTKTTKTTTTCEPLTAEALRAALTGLPGWELRDGLLQRALVLGSFPAAIDAVVAIAAIAEQAQHHPDIDVRYQKVTLRLCTHDAGGAITSLDIDLASAINAAFRDR